MLIDIYRAGSIYATVPVDENSWLTQEIMGQDCVNLSFVLRQFVAMQIGDYITVGGQNYYMNLLPDVKKVSTIDFQYTCVFESAMYDLAKVQFMLEGQSDFYLMGDANTFINLVVTNMNRVGSGWTRGAVITTKYVNLYFSGENCLEVLHRLAQEFETEFYITNKQVNFQKTNPVNSALFRYGKGKGAYSISRKGVDSKNIITRLYPYGAERNIQSAYRNYSKRLMIGEVGANYIETNTSIYGIIEATKIWEEIYPRRTGTITWINSTNFLVFRDSTLDFDLNLYLIPGVKAKLHFQTGDLAGYEFEILSYTHANREFTLITNTDEKAYSLPNSSIKPAAGNTYVLLDITMPQSYITAAETELRTQATTYLNQNCSPRVSYEVEPDWTYIKENGITISLRDYIHVTDVDLGIDRYVRTVRLRKNLVNQYRIEFELADEVAPKPIQRLYASVENTERIVRLNGMLDVASLKRNWLGTEELRKMVYDIDGYFDTDNFKANSIETNMLSVGTKSGQFALSGLVIQPNYLGNKANCEISAGTLTHYTIYSTPKSWSLTASSHAGLTDGTAYYIYARVERAGSAGTTILSSTIQQVDEGSTYYFFLLGVLHSVVDGIRDISMTYGHTRINGRYITTGRIQDAAGTTFIDLDTGDIQGVITFLPGSSVPGATATLAIGIKKNTVAWSSASNGYCYIHGFDSDTGNPSDSNGYLYIDGTKVTVPKVQYSNYSLVAKQVGAGFILFDYSGSKRFSLYGGGSTDIVFVKKTSGVWWFDNGYSWTEFTVGASDVLIGSLSVGTYGTVKEAYVSAYGYSVNSATDPTADMTKTVIDGGLITTGRLEVGPGALGANNAGVNGAGSGGTDIRFWAGDTYANRATAPFRVQQDGTVALLKALLQSATSGKRVIINSAGNILESYNGNNNLAIVLDESGVGKVPYVKVYNGGGTTYFAELAYNKLDLQGDIRLQYGDYLMKGVPTFSTSLVSGAVYKDASNFLKIVP